MGILDFLRDAGDTRGAEKSDDAMEELRTGNTVIRKMRGLDLPVEGIEVDFDDGVATLTGTAPDQETREMMVLVAGNTPGVARVDDRLQVGGGAGVPDWYHGRTVTVRKGDTLSELSQEHLADASRWKEIYEANRPMLDDPDEIYPGQVLRLPDR